MRVKDLIDDIYALGFENAEINRNILSSAIRRALITISTDYPTETKHVVYVSTITPSIHYRSIHYNGKDELLIPLSGMSLSFEIGSGGTAELRDRNGLRSYSFPKGGQCREFLSGEGTIRFFGPTSYDIYNLAAFSELSGSSRDDIPLLEKEKELNIADICKDFLSFSRLPQTIEGTAIPNSRASNESIFLPGDYNGGVEIYYFRAPRALNIDMPDERVAILPVLYPLLPLLAASYIWLEDEPERSTYYMSLYRDGMSILRHRMCAHLNAQYRDTLGWA